MAVDDSNAEVGSTEGQAPTSAGKTAAPAAPSAPPAAAERPVVAMSELIQAGVHFGHQTRRWNPKMKRFLHGDVGGTYIIDLKQTLAQLEAAYLFVRNMVADGGTLLFVGTKKQTQESTALHAKRCGMPYVNERWLGGMLTNIETIFKRVHKMQEYQRMQKSGEFEAMPKKEALSLRRELAKLERNLGGIGKMNTPPEAVFVLDTKTDHIAVSEANKLRIPLIAVVDTNCDPDVADFVIPGNDDSIRSGDLMCRIMADAVIAGKRFGRLEEAPQSVQISEDVPAQATTAPATPMADEEAAAASAVEVPTPAASEEEPVPRSAAEDASAEEPADAGEEQPLEESLGDQAAPASAAEPPEVESPEVEPPEAVAAPEVEEAVEEPGKPEAPKASRDSDAPTQPQAPEKVEAPQPQPASEAPAQPLEESSSPEGSATPPQPPAEEPSPSVDSPESAQPSSAAEDPEKSEGEEDDQSDKKSKRWFRKRSGSGTR